MEKIDSIALANYVLLKGGPMNHLKLQKIIYYVEAYHLALFGNSLIDDEFEAWVHGPVSRKLWKAFSKYSVYNLISFDRSRSREIENTFTSFLSEIQATFVNRVISGAKSKTGNQLEALSHVEDPWRNARKGLSPGLPSRNLISKTEMTLYYKTKYSEKGTK
jgi:uncharacterized phage-associated protein